MLYSGYVLLLYSTLLPCGVILHIFRSNVVGKSTENINYSFWSTSLFAKNCIQLRVNEKITLINVYLEINLTHLI